MGDPKESVNHPAHYGGADDPFEAIKVIEAWGLGFNLGNAVKYLARAGKKWDRVDDLRKALFYIRREIGSFPRLVGVDTEANLQAALKRIADLEAAALAHFDERPGMNQAPTRFVVVAPGNFDGPTLKAISELVDQANESIRVLSEDRDRWIEDHRVITRRADREGRRADDAERKIRTLEAATTVVIHESDLSVEKIAELVKIFNPASTPGYRGKVEITPPDLSEDPEGVTDHAVISSGLTPEEAKAQGERCGKCPSYRATTCPHGIPGLKIPMVECVGSEGVIDGWTCRGCQAFYPREQPICPDCSPRDQEGSRPEGVTDQDTIQIECLVNGHPVTVEAPRGRARLKVTTGGEEAASLNIAVNLSEVRMAALHASNARPPYDDYEIRTEDGNRLDPGASVNLYDLTGIRIVFSKPVGKGG